MKMDLKKLYQEYPECFQDSAKFKAYLIDLCPEEKKARINILATMLEQGVLTPAQTEDTFDDVAFCKRICDDYGYDSNLVKECFTLFADMFKFKSAILNIKPSESVADIIEFVEDSYVSTEDALSTLKECIYKCSYVIKSLKEYKGQAYYKLAVHLHDIDGWLRFECEGFEPPMPQNWHGYQEEISAICELTAVNTNNVNVLIEKLLLLAYQYGCEEAENHLLETYLAKLSYDDYYQEYSDGEFPWFDIMSMGNDYNSFTEEIDGYGSEQSDEILILNAKKAMVMLPSPEDIPDRFSSEYVFDLYFRIALRLNDDDFRGRILVAENGRAHNGDVYCARMFLSGKEESTVVPDKVIERAETGDGEAQALMADYYTRRFNKTNNEMDFDNAVKWHERAICNNRTFTLLGLLKQYIDLLKSRNATLYQEKIGQLENLYSGEYDYCYRYL